MYWTPVKLEKGKHRTVTKKNISTYYTCVIHTSTLYVIIGTHAQENEIKKMSGTVV